jgi:hypothetical protein
MVCQAAVTVNEVEDLVLFINMYSDVSARFDGGRRVEAKAHQPNLSWKGTPRHHVGGKRGWPRNGPWALPLNWLPKQIGNTQLLPRHRLF